MQIAARRGSNRRIGSSELFVCKEQIRIRSDLQRHRSSRGEHPSHCPASKMPPPARYLRSHAEGLLLEGGEPGLRPLLITAGKDGGVACRVVHRDRRPSLPQESAHPSLAAQTAPKVRIEGLFGVYAFSGGPYAAVILESEPLLKRDKSTQVFADAKLRWPRDACHAFRLRRATKVAVVPVSNANRRLSKRQAQDEALCLRLLESALRKRPWVFSRDSDAATLTSTRASDARDYALAERQALRQRGSIKAEDAARQRFERADAAFLWNQRVLAPVVCFGVEIEATRVASMAWGAVCERPCAIDAALVDGVEGRGLRDAESVKGHGAHASRRRRGAPSARAHATPRA